MPHAPEPTRPCPELKPTQEIRFAVVMYGGVSLAIYMNGVAQEMLRLVRATAPAVRDGREAKRDLKGTELVYRKLGQMLCRGGKPLPLEKVEANPASPITTRFIVDVISGTSAGGINGVFLAKALANEQSMDDLKRLWVEEGDFGKLMNDDWRLPGLPPPPQSLLDGRHMYGELLRALEGMEEGADSADSADAPNLRSPYVEELDLFVTATDISGLTLPIQLADDVVQERRHRNTFHFVYTTPRASGASINNFSRRFNPFLAFAARCTSSFPVAFEPMRLSDIDDTVRAVPYYRGQGRKLDEFLSASETWLDFFEDYLAPSNHAEGANASGEEEGDGVKEAARNFAARNFGDGGYLDNKPFSYATETLVRRRADVPVERKLIFVDPDPQNPQLEQDLAGDVDLLRNTLSALSPTVSTETIREDIQRIIERNRLIERMRIVTDGAEKDIRTRGATYISVADPDTGATVVRDASSLWGEVWAGLDVDDFIVSKGIAYGGYYRLKVGSVTDDLATVVVNAANFRRDSDEFFAVRQFMRVWRDEAFDVYKGGDRPTLNQFLLDFDLDYRLRRLNFLRTKINELSGLGPEELAEALAGRTTVELPDDAGALKGFHEYFQRRLPLIQAELNEVYISLLSVERKYRQRGERNPLHRKAFSTGVNKSVLRDILRQRNEGEAYAAARLYFQSNEETFRDFEVMARLLRWAFRRATARASAECARILNPPADGSLVANETRAARELLWGYYTHFEDYDMVTFPIAYQTGVGETVPVDVIRVSPYDATSLIKEADEDAKERAGKPYRHKLGGRELGHFGAFFEKAWRRNDIMWGRLDAVERIIDTMLPEPNTGDKELDKQIREDRAALLEEAQKAILAEDLLPPGEDELRRDYVSELNRNYVGQLAKAAGRNAPAEAYGRKRLAEQMPGSAALNSILDACVRPEELLKYFGARDEYRDAGYEVDRRLNRQETTRLLARSTKVFGKMLETLADQRRIKSKSVAWVTRLGQIFWGFVEVAMPNSIWNLLFRRLVSLLYFFEAVLVVGGLILSDSAMSRFGLVLLALTAAAHAFVTVLGDFMRGDTYRLARTFGVLAAIPLGLLLIASAALGLDELVGLGADGLVWFFERPAVQALLDWPPVGAVVVLVGFIPRPLRVIVLVVVALIALALAAVLLGALLLTARLVLHRLERAGRRALRRVTKTLRAARAGVTGWFGRIRAR